MLMIPSLAIAALKDKNIVVLGVGMTGLSCARFLRACDIYFSVNDSRKAPIDVQDFAKTFSNTELVLGCWHEQLIANADIIIVSPGIDLAQTGIHDMVQPNTELWGDIELFCFVNCFLENPLPILAVTGSNGKSTVVSMLAYVGNELGVNTALGGNIGQPVLDLFTEMLFPELLVWELSSFQLETITRMQSVAASVLNVSDDHLDRHLTLDNYQAIKQRIYQNTNIAVVNRDDKRTQFYTENNSTQQIISFGSDKPKQGQFGLATSEPGEIQLMFGEQVLIELAQLPLAGIHNALNYLAVLALGFSAGWPLLEMVGKLKGFTGLAHRCQVVDTADGIHWINDSKATNVGATLAAINGLAKTLAPNQQFILIAGGDGKGADFTPLQPEILTHVNVLITLGKDGDDIAALAATSAVNCLKVSNLEQAVAKAHKIAKAGDIVLLSPACSSLDMFKNFAVRGECFIDAVTHAASNTVKQKTSEVRYDRN
jgi:UDP-N-acetylmuramoylalanine--D-glutamate ligase